jgi:hypothetical protein
MHARAAAALVKIWRAMHTNLGTCYILLYTHDNPILSFFLLPLFFNKMITVCVFHMYVNDVPSYCPSW